MIGCDELGPDDRLAIALRDSAARRAVAERLSEVVPATLIAATAVIGPEVEMGEGNVWVEDGAYVGTGAVIKQGTAGKPTVIGAGAIIGMGAVVTKSVPPGVTVIGNPARPLEPRPAT